MGGILTKYEQKCNLFKMSMSQKFRNVGFSEIKAPQGATRHKGAFQKLEGELIRSPGVHFQKLTSRKKVLFC